MLSVKAQENLIGSPQIQKIETSFKDVQQEIDASYNRINISIDKIFTSYDLNTVLMTKSTFEIQFKTLEIPSNLKIQPNELIQEIRPLLKTIVSKVVQKKEQSLNEIHQKQLQQVQQKFNNLQEEKKREYDQIQKMKAEEMKQKEMRQQEQQIITQSQIKYNLNPFKFQYMENNFITQNDQCYAVAINKDNSIVVVGCGNQIKVYEFKQGKLNQIQLLTEHPNRVFILSFMKLSNHFISGGDNNTIIIWYMQQNNQWTCQQKLNGHSNWIYCLILNNNEDLIISGSSDYCIKFWDKQNGWLCQQTINDHTNYVWSLSLNEQQNKLISCSEDSQILVIEQSQKDKKWNVIQKIKVDQNGYRLCFINNNLFTFQPYAKEQMHIYEMKNCDKQFDKIKEIKVQSGSNSCDFQFPQQYIKSKCLLVNKNGYNINFIRKKQNGEFINEQTIQFEHYHIYGTLSDDGEYLITWDEMKRQIQIRKCNEG